MLSLSMFKGSLGLSHCYSNQMNMLLESEFEMSEPFHFLQVAGLYPWLKIRGGRWNLFWEDGRLIIVMF